MAAFLSCQQSSHCHWHYLPNMPSSFPRYDVMECLRPGGVVLVNASWTSFEEIEKVVPPKTRARLAALRPQVRLLLAWTAS